MEREPSRLVLIVGAYGSVLPDCRRMVRESEWRLGLDPEAGPALRISALGHDIERAVEARKLRRWEFADRDIFKAAHARSSAPCWG